MLFFSCIFKLNWIADDGMVFWFTCSEFIYIHTHENWKLHSDFAWINQLYIQYLQWYSV